MAEMRRSWATRTGFGALAILFWVVMALLPVASHVWMDGSGDYWLFMGQSMLVYAIAVLGLKREQSIDDRRQVRRAVRRQRLARRVGGDRVVQLTSEAWPLERLVRPVPGHHLVEHHTH